ncbi:hypothetical protein SAMN05892883_0846 [Jatrophihabitans sp. GAS493]|uniref:hypothetical protein n=1 Tax=Jatrophihabitans sp. GAS493 TaxID=1907575 RepID=UPI000BB7E0EC|nr:hypothetical protein [Jatrophihabitans sp. GAS493]SOD71305.1 hypothetical protein SAMN05892883_0846 [Jatrophihabitans sp. GAS493]
MELIQTSTDGLTELRSDDREIDQLEAVLASLPEVPEVAEVTVRALPSRIEVAEPEGSAAVDLLVELAGYVAVIATTIVAFFTMYSHIGDFDAGAPAFIAIGDKALLLAGTLVGTAVGALIAYLMRRTLKDYRRRSAITRYTR